MRHFFTAIVLLMALSAASVQVQELSMTISDIDQELQTETLTLTLLNDGTEPASTFEFPLPLNIQNLEVENAEYVNGSFHFTALHQNSSQEITATFNTKFQVTGDSEKILLSNNIIPVDTKLLRTILRMPQGYYLLPELDPVQPKTSPGASFTTDGRIISVTWEKQDVKKGEQVQYTLGFKLEESHITNVITMPFLENTIPQEALVPIILFAFFFGYFLAAGFGGLLVNLIKNVTVGLTEDENTVVELLKSGQLKQREIQKKTGFSKAKLSRLLAEMEQRKLIAKESKGRTNVIRLK